MALLNGGSDGAGLVGAGMVGSGRDQAALVSRGDGEEPILHTELAVAGGFNRSSLPKRLCTVRSDRRSDRVTAVAKRPSARSPST